MKNLWNLGYVDLGSYFAYDKEQQLILIGSIILPGGSLILIFSRLGRLITRKLGKAKTLKTYGKGGLTKKELKEDLERFNNESVV